MEGQQIFVPLCSPVGIAVILVGGFRLISRDLISADMQGFCLRICTPCWLFLVNKWLPISPYSPVTWLCIWNNFLTKPRVDFC